MEGESAFADEVAGVGGGGGPVRGFEVFEGGFIVDADGDGLAFDAEVEVEGLVVGDVIDDSPVSSFTACAWFRTDVAPPDPLSNSDWVFETSGAPTISLGVADDEGGNSRVAFFTAPAPGPASLGMRNIVPDSFVAAQWVHGLYTHDATTNTLQTYIDGVPLLSASYTESDLRTITGFHIGTYRSATDRWFDGLIDEVAIWDRVLSSGEIAQLYNNGSGISIIPEPTRALLLVLGAVGVVMRRRRTA